MEEKIGERGEDEREQSSEKSRKREVKASIRTDRMVRFGVPVNNLEVQQKGWKGLRNPH